ncbi:MAG: hypothetical protein E7047_10145 [Lentisphaerae bacterium]|nr:hypothetical protein [Lentisphaerota bacterium]
MQLDLISKKYGLSPEVTEFMQQYGYDAARQDFCWPLAELAGDRLAQRCAALELTDALPELEAMLSKTSTDESLQRVIHYIFYYWYKLDNALIYGYKLPDLEAMTGAEDAGLLHMLIAIAGCGAIEKKFAAMQLPPEYAAAALRRIPENSTAYFQQYNRRGFPESGQHWMRFFVEGKLFRIGRFEYMIEPLIMKLLPHVYKHRSSGRIVALCRDGWQFNAEGLMLWRDIAEKPYCIAKLEDHGSFVRGIPVDPNGFAAVDTIIELNKNDYELLWNDNDFVPDMHIPPGGNMHLELCRESLLAAQKFFPEHLGMTPRAFACFSWIFNPDFQDVLPESNLSKFMREVYLTPFSGSSLAGLSFVFGKQDQDWSHYPAVNSLQRAFHQLRKNNRRLKEGGMFIEAAGLKEFGTQFYRNNY